MLNMPKVLSIEEKRIHQIHIAYSLENQTLIRSLAKKHNVSIADYILTACKFYDKNFKNEADSMFELKKE